MVAQPSLREFEAIVLDVNGTLIRPVSEMRHYEVMALLLDRPLSLVKAVFGKLAAEFEVGLTAADRMERALLALGKTATAAHIRDLILIEAYFAALPMRAYEGALEQLPGLRLLFKVGVCSNQNPIGLAVAKRFGLHEPPLVDAAVFSCEFGRAKPDPMIYAEICQRLNIPRTKCLFVGDGSSRELVGAKEAGMVTMRVMQEGGYAHEFADDPDVTADYELKHISMLADWLDVPAL